MGAFGKQCGRHRDEAACLLGSGEDLFAAGAVQTVTRF